MDDSIEGADASVRFPVESRKIRSTSGKCIRRGVHQRPFVDRCESSFGCFLAYPQVLPGRSGVYLDGSAAHKTHA